MISCAGCTYQELLLEIRQEFPEFKIAWKFNSRLMKCIGWFLYIITLGKVTTFHTKYITVIGCTVYVPEAWGSYADATRMIILRHERVHMRQRRRYTMPLYTLLYLFAPLPGFCAYFRMCFEKEAYEETLRATVELLQNGYEIVKTETYKKKLIEDFVGPAYFWMWPFRTYIERWYDAAVSRAQVHQAAE